MATLSNLPRMRVAIITESYAPDVNGVANSVVHVADHLHANGHRPLVITPSPRRGLRKALPDKPYPVLRLPSLPMPGYPNVRLAPPSRQIKRALLAHQPEVVHLASPFVLGAWGSRAAADLDIPLVAVYQTDVPGYAGAYGIGPTRNAAWRWIARIHGRARLTLAPSSATAEQLSAHGVRHVTRWGRGVDTALFHPSRRDVDLRRKLAPEGEVLVGYVGRLAHEKRVDDLREVVKLPGVQVVVVGDGPTRKKIEAALPGALFLGPLGGIELARLYASLDVFVHTGPHETFCQTIQEAHASGVPVVAPASGGPLDLVEPGVTGALVPALEPSAFAEAVRALAADPLRRRRFGLAARRAVAGRSWANLCEELIGHYHTAAGLPHSSAPAELNLLARLA